MAEAVAPLELRGERLDCLGGEVRSPIGSAMRRDPRQQESAANADFQDTPRVPRHDPIHRPLPPLVHLVERDRLAVIAAVPAGETLAEGSIAKAVALIKR